MKENHPHLPEVLRELFNWCLRIAMAVVFLYAGIVKAGDSESFFIGLVPFTFIPDSWILPIATVLPWIEIAVGLGLLIPRTTRPASFAAGLLLMSFMAVLLYALSQDIIVSCSCFGEDETPSAAKMWWAVARDGVFLAVALWLSIPRSLARRKVCPCGEGND